MDKNRKLEDDSKAERKKQFKRMMDEVRVEKEDLTKQLEHVKNQLNNLDPDSSEFRQLWDQKYKLEREVRQDWY